MRPIAFLASADVFGAFADKREDAFEVEAQLKALDGPCRERGFLLQSVIWDDPSIDWSRYDAALIGATWDYMNKKDAFLAALDRIAAAVPLFNSPAVARWNIDKGYLAELDARGVRTVPTLWRDRADPPSLAAAFDALGAEEIIVKPRVGAGAWRQARLRRGEPAPPADELPPGAAMIQPFLTSVATAGETSYLFFDGAFSHALTKRPAPGDYRVQSLYGGRETVRTPTAEELSHARSAVEAAAAILGERLLYARVDMVAGQDGAPLLMELELIEPYYYPDQGPDCGAIFAAALERFVTG
ncbi:MAG: transporter [Caulobacterales bacterium]|nr:transporter [Caulobacterales bacterium]